MENTVEESTLPKPSKLRIWLRNLGIVLAIALISMRVWSYISERQGAQLLATSNQVQHGMILTEVRDVLGANEESQSVESVVFKDGILRSAENDKARPSDLEDLMLCTWHGGSARVTVVCGLDERVRGIVKWDTDPPRPRSLPPWFRKAGFWLQRKLGM